MADGYRALDDLIARVRRAGTAPKQLAPVAADALRAELTANIAAGTAPDGAPWKRTQAGEQPLRNAARALEVRAEGTVVLATLTGPEARHHLGTARGHIVRRILPNARTVPAKTIEALRKAFAGLCRG